MLQDALYRGGAGSDNTKNFFLCPPSGSDVQTSFVELAASSSSVSAHFSWIQGSASLLQAFPELWDQKALEAELMRLMRLVQNSLLVLFASTAWSWPRRWAAAGPPNVSCDAWWAPAPRPRADEPVGINTTAALDPAEQHAHTDQESWLCVSSLQDTSWIPFMA